MRFDVEEQIRSGLLVCPETRQPLTVRDGRLVTPDGEHSYPYVNGVPILIDAETQASYLSENNEAMVGEYSAVSSGAARQAGAGQARSFLDSLLEPIRRRVLNPGEDYCSAESREAWRVVSEQPDDALCLAVGGLVVHPAQRAPPVVERGVALHKVGIRAARRQLRPRPVSGEESALVVKAPRLDDERPGDACPLHDHGS